MSLENGDKAMLARIDERTMNLGIQMSEMVRKLETLSDKFITRDQCALNQQKHSKTTWLDRAESLGKVAAIVAIAVSVVFAVLKHA